MKKKRAFRRNRDVLIGILHRQGRTKQRRRADRHDKDRAHNQEYEDGWLDGLLEKGLNAQIVRRRSVDIYLPEKMNFSDRYDETILYITAIRKLAKAFSSPHTLYKIGHVHFNELQQISTSAALVLTAELSLWQDQLPGNLTPRLETWNPEILTRFRELGFFDLFGHGKLNLPCNGAGAQVRIVKYVKGSCKNKSHGLKLKMLGIVGREKIAKWPMLSGGLDEAITNVGHHAYPEGHPISDHDKNWYLTGAFDTKTNEMKIVFYDQGVGIPGSLPASKHWEKITKLLSEWDLPMGQRWHHSTLIQGAMEHSRTRTDNLNRGKGLQDLLEFIKERGAGYLSIISGHGLCKYSIENGKERTKTEHFSSPVLGTLIIWKVTLGDKPKA